MWGWRRETARQRQYQATLKAAASYARRSGLVVHVVLPQEPAEQAGLGMTTTVEETTIAFRFAVPPVGIASSPLWSSDEQLSPN